MCVFTRECAGRLRASVSSSVCWGEASVHLTGVCDEFQVCMSCAEMGWRVVCAL